MLPQSLRLDENDARSHLLALAGGLLSEIRTGLREPEAADLSERTEKLLRDIEGADLRSFGMWQRAVHAYEALACAVAGARNGRARVARSYSTMEELHEDAGAQAAGRSPHAVWETHEHGRRRQLEAAIAACHRAESALLLNSGASAVAVAIAALRLPRGATILIGRRGHVETAEYLTRFVAPLGVKVVHVPVGSAGAVLDALRTLRPEAALFETAVNAPGGDVPSGVPRWLDASPGTLFVVDNTAQSVLTRWFGGPMEGGERLVVLESATKHLAQQCTAGLLYGPAAAVERMREVARATGQLLQEKAFNFLRPAEIVHLPWKLARHAANVRVFVQELGAAAEVSVHTLDSAADGEARAALFPDGPAGVVFVQRRGHRGGERAHHEILAEWQSEARRHGAWIPVRAGFGWRDTTAFVHEPGRSRPEGGPPYLRISVGIEPENVARCLARALAAACAGAPRSEGVRPRCCAAVPARAPR
jgi:cystathionine beta-lyase/cystathionine gamma-synthase